MKPLSLISFLSRDCRCHLILLSSILLKFWV
jgi:hypothetical protein